MESRRNLLQPPEPPQPSPTYLGAVFLERRRQVGSDVLGRPTLDVLSLEHEDQRAVLEEPHLGRRRRVAREVAPGPLGRLGVLPREYRQQTFGSARMLERKRRRGPRVPSR